MDGVRIAQDSQQYEFLDADIEEDAQLLKEVQVLRALAHKVLFQGKLCQTIGSLFNCCYNFFMHSSFDISIFCSLLYRLRPLEMPMMVSLTSIGLSCVDCMLCLTAMVLIRL